jgi:hypothetical protein
MNYIAFDSVIFDLLAGCVTTLKPCLSNHSVIRGAQATLFNILHLLAHLLDQHLHVHTDPGDLQG